METIQKRNITTEKAIALLRKEGLALSSDDAETVVDLLYLLAEIFISEITEDENS